MVPSVAGHLLHNGVLQDLSVLPPLVHCRNKQWRALQFANGHRCSCWAASCICIVLIPVSFSSLSTHWSLTDSITAAGLGVLTWWLSFLRGSNCWPAALSFICNLDLGPKAEAMLPAQLSWRVAPCRHTSMRATRLPARQPCLAGARVWPLIILVHDCWIHMEKLSTCWILVLVLVYIHNHLYMWSICTVYEW